MTGAKILAVVAKYRLAFEEARIEKNPHPRDQTLISPAAGFSHCHWMIDQIEIFVDQGQIGKAFRWLGFIQCFLWSQGLHTIGELAEQSRSDEEETNDKSG